MAKMVEIKIKVNGKEVSYKDAREIYYELGKIFDKSIFTPPHTPLNPFTPIGSFPEPWREDKWIKDKDVDRTPVMF